MKNVARRYQKGSSSCKKIGYIAQKKIIIKRVLWEFMGASSHGDAIYNIAP